MATSRSACQLRGENGNAPERDRCFKAIDKWAGDASVIEVAVGYADTGGMFLAEVVSSPAGKGFLRASLDIGFVLSTRPQFQQTLPASAVTARQILTPADRELPAVALLWSATCRLSGLSQSRKAGLSPDRGLQLALLRVDRAASVMQREWPSTSYRPQCSSRWRTAARARRLR